jgi:MFS family permease
MATTALFAEILVIGLLALPWFGLAVVSTTRVSLQSIPDLRGWDGLVLAVGLAFAYALGIVVDRLGDWAFERWDERLSQVVRKTNHLPGSTLPERPELRFHLMDKAPPLVMEFLDYARSRRRILRGITVNCVLTLILALGTLIIGWIIGVQLQPTALLLCLIGVSIGMGGGALFGWSHIGRMYYGRSLVAFRLFGPRPEDAHVED